MSKGLKGFSDAELEAELAKRAEAKNKLERPKPLANPDWHGLIDFVEAEVKSADEDEDYYDGGDFRHYVYEEVMRTVYGNDFFKWWNKKVHGKD